MRHHRAEQPILPNRDHLRLEGTMNQAKKTAKKHDNPQLWIMRTPPLPFWQRVRLLWKGRLTLPVKCADKPILLGIKVGVDDE